MGRCYVSICILLVCSRAYMIRIILITLHKALTLILDSPIRDNAWLVFPAINSVSTMIQNLRKRITHHWTNIYIMSVFWTAHQNCAYEGFATLGMLTQTFTMVHIEIIVNGDLEKSWKLGKGFVNASVWPIYLNLLFPCFTDKKFSGVNVEW